MTLKKNKNEGDYKRRVVAPRDIKVRVNRHRLKITNFEVVTLPLGIAFIVACFISVIIVGIGAGATFLLKLEINHPEEGVFVVYLILALTGLIGLKLNHVKSNVQILEISSKGENLSSPETDRIVGVSVVRQMEKYEVHLTVRGYVLKTTSRAFHSLTRERAEHIAQLIDEYLQLNTPYDDLFMIEQFDADEVNHDAK